MIGRMTKCQANKTGEVISAGGTAQARAEGGGSPGGASAGCRAVGGEAAWREQAEASLRQGPGAGP